MSGYEAKKLRMATTLREQAGSVRLAKGTSNLFRDRRASAARLDVRDLD